jgi:hypothetical protein
MQLSFVIIAISILMCFGKKLCIKFFSKATKILRVLSDGSIETKSPQHIN